MADDGTFRLILADPAWMSWVSVPSPAGLRWVGVAIGVPTVALGIWTFRSLGRNITETRLRAAVPGGAPSAPASGC